METKSSENKVLQMNLCCLLILIPTKNHNIVQIMFALTVSNTFEEGI